MLHLSLLDGAHHSALYERDAYYLAGKTKRMLIVSLLLGGDQY